MSAAEPAVRLQHAEPRLPPAARRDGTAGRVLATALSLFARRGFHGTSIRDIGQELGLKPANLYEHFHSKEHVLAELVRVGHEEHLRALRAALIEHGPGPAEKLAAVVRAHVRMHCEYAMLAVVANSEMHALSPELAAPSLALRGQAEAILADVVRRGTELGVFDPPHAFLATAAIGGMGVRVAHWYRDDFELSPAQIADTYAELALRMMTRRAP